MKKNSFLFEAIKALFLFFPYFVPRLIILDDRAALINNIWLCFTIVYAAIIFINSLNNKKKTNKLIMIVFIYKIWESAVIIINNRFNIIVLISTISFISFVIICDYYLTNMRKFFFQFLSVFLSSIIFINNLSYYLITDNNNIDAAGNIIYFWSTKNHLSGICILAVVVIIINFSADNFIDTKKGFIKLLSLINIIWSVIIFKSATLIVGMIAFILLVLLIKVFPKIYLPKTLIIIAFIIQIMVVFFEFQNVFSWFIEGVLNKQTNLSSRTIVWDTALAYIKSNPIIGYGSDSLIRAFWITSKYVTIPAHNQFMQVIIKSGLVGFAIFLYMFMFSINNIEKNKRGLADKILFCSFFACSIMMITEAVSPYTPWYAIMCITCHLKEINSDYYITRRSISRGFCVKKRRVKGERD